MVKVEVHSGGAPGHSVKVLTGHSLITQLLMGGEGSGVTLVLLKLL